MFYNIGPKLARQEGKAKLHFIIAAVFALNFASVNRA
jgi:hypothetical protein